MSEGGAARPGGGDVAGAGPGRGVPGGPGPGAAGARRTGRRRIAVLVLAALAGAGCCAGAAGVGWWSREYHDALTGPLRVTAHGSALLGELVPIALVALAGLGATFASRGVLRRIVGVLVGLGGLLVVVRAALAMGSAPTGQLAGQLTRPATPTGPAELAVAGPLLAVVGGALIGLAGVLIATGADRTARSMGSAYDAPARRREQALQHARARGGRVDPALLWRAMDAGADPTDDGTVPADGLSRAAGTAGVGHPDPAGAGRPDPAGAGHPGPAGPDTMSAPDKPGDTARAGDHHDRTDRLDDRPDRPGPTGQA